MFGKKKLFHIRLFEGFILQVVPSAGLEPATYSLGNCRSVLMSYEGVIAENTL